MVKFGIMCSTRDKISSYTSHRAHKLALKLVFAKVPENASSIDWEAHELYGGKTLDECLEISNELGEQIESEMHRVRGFLMKELAEDFHNKLIDFFE